MVFPGCSTNNFWKVGQIRPKKQCPLSLILIYIIISSCGLNQESFVAAHVTETQTELPPQEIDHALRVDKSLCNVRWGVGEGPK